MLETCPKDFSNFTICNILLDVDARVERVTNLSESAKTTQLRKKWWRNLSKHSKYWGNWVEENRGYIRVVATVITTLTFQQAASPPGGVWSQSGNVTFYTGHNIKIWCWNCSYRFYRSVVLLLFHNIQRYLFYCISHCHLLTNCITTKNVYYNNKKNHCNNIEVIAIVYPKCCNKI